MKLPDLHNLEQRGLTWFHSVSRAKVWIGVCALGMVMVVLFSIGIAIHNALDFAETQGEPQVMRTLQEVHKLKTELREWKDKYGKPLKCPPVVVPKNEKATKEFQNLLPPGWILVDPASFDPMTVMPSGERRAAAISTTGVIGKHKCGEGCNVGVIRPLDGSPEFVSFTELNPRFAFDNLWTGYGGYVYDSVYKHGAHVGITWEPISFRLSKKTQYRLFTALGAEGMVFNNQSFYRVTIDEKVHIP